MPGDSERQLETDHIGAMLIAENVEVLAVQQTIVDIAPTAPGQLEEDDESAGAGDATDAGDPDANNDRTRASDAEANADAATYTLLVTPEQAQQIFCAEASGSLRLMLHAFGDESPTGLPPAVCTLEAGDEAPIPQ
jgi:Flp pilus assembly protein CpaB